MTSDKLYESMAKHPDTGPIMELLQLVEPVDEFSRALCLVRDCFAQGGTLRLLSRNKLRGMLQSRVSLMMAYQKAVIDAVPGARSFTEAVAIGDPVSINALRADFDVQARMLMSRPLEKS